jgi:hypothetical protein
VRSGLQALPDLMAAAGRRAGSVERGIVDLVEAALLAGREGELFPAVVIDEKVVQLTEPAVRGRLEKGAPEVGSDVTVRLLHADLERRSVGFALANDG